MERKRILKYYDVNDRVAMSWLPPRPTEAGAASVVDSIVADAQRISASRPRSARRGLGRVAAPAWRGDRRVRLRRRLLAGVGGIVLRCSRVADRCRRRAPRRPRCPLAGSFVHAPATAARPHASAAGRDLRARASPRVRGSDLDWTWLVVGGCPAGPRTDRAARRALRPQGATRGGVADRALPRIRGLPGTHAAAVCALALLSHAPLSYSQLSLRPKGGHCRDRAR